MNLSQTAKVFRNFVKIAIGVIALYYLSTILLIPALRTVYNQLNPPKNPANPVYGLLDPLEFTEKRIINAQPEYVLNTNNGRLPGDLPPVMLIYKFKFPKFSYEAGKNARNDARVLGFNDSDLVTDLKGNNYRWRNITTDGSLDIKIDSREIKLFTQLDASKSSFFPAGSLTLDNSKTISRNLFASLFRFNDDLYTSGTQVVRLGKFLAAYLAETKIPSEAQLAKVDFYREINKYKILGPDPSKGLLHAIVKNPDTNTPLLNYPIVEAYYWEIDPQSNAYYPIISASEAWGAVVLGKGVIVNVTSKDANPFQDYTPVKVDRVLINNIYLAYYDTPKLQKVLQPIYVFEGKYTNSLGDTGTVTVYFPAVQGQHVKQPTPATSQTQPNL